MIQIHDIKQGTDEWKEIRAGKFTGTSAYKLLKFGSIDYSLTEKTNFRGNFWTKRGHILEDEAIELYEQIKRITVDRPGIVSNTDFPLCAYSPDALYSDRVIEVKCFSPKKHMELYKGNIPFEIQAQIHFGMLICQKELAHLIIYNPELGVKESFKVIEIKSNRNIKANFRRILCNSTTTKNQQTIRPRQSIAKAA